MKYFIRIIISNNSFNNIYIYHATENFILPDFCSSDDILTTDPVITHIHLSSIHFGIDETDTPYIHLNNDSPYDEQFYHVWAQLEKAHSLGIKIVLMVGGAGGGYLSMSDDYETYGLLKELIGNKPIISGIDLDVEEPVNMDMIQRLIRDIKTDMPRPLTVSMAPVQSALESDDPWARWVLL